VALCGQGSESSQIFSCFLLQILLNLNAPKFPSNFCNQSVLFCNQSALSKKLTSVISSKKSNRFHNYPIKDVRSQRELSCADIFRTRGGFFRYGRLHIMKQNFGFFKIYGVSERIREVEPVRIFFGQVERGSIFSRFCACVFYWRLLIRLALRTITILESYCKELSIYPQVSSQTTGI